MDIRIEANREIHNKIAKRYNSKHKDIFSLQEQARISQALERIKDRLDPGGRTALDYGCGTGNVTRHLIAKGYSVTSADISQKFLDLITAQFGRHHGLRTLLLSGNVDDDLKDLKFDLICVYSVLHHIPDYLAALRSLCKHLEVGGLLYIDREASPNYWSNPREYVELQKKSARKKIIIGLKNLVSVDWYLNRFRMFMDPRFQPDGDIHVWPNDHIEWAEVDKLMEENGLRLIERTDYLSFKPYYNIKVFEEFGTKADDMRQCVYLKESAL